MRKFTVKVMDNYGDIYFEQENMARRRVQAIVMQKNGVNGSPAIVKMPEDNITIYKYNNGEEIWIYETIGEL